MAGRRRERNWSVVYNTPMKRANLTLAARGRRALLLLPYVVGMVLVAPVPAPQEARQDTLAMQAPGPRLVSVRAAPASLPAATLVASGTIIVSAPVVAAAEPSLPQPSLPTRSAFHCTALPRAPPA